MTIRICKKIITCFAHRLESALWIQYNPIFSWLVLDSWKNVCSSLRYLSLRMCKLSDNGIQKIVNELKYRDPPDDPKLIALNVADNDITDIGADYIAAMLRTNRLCSCKTFLRILIWEDVNTFLRKSNFNKTFVDVLVDLCKAWC